MIFSHCFWPVTMQRYNSVPWDVKRGGRFGRDLTLRRLVILSAAKNLSAQAKSIILLMFTDSSVPSEWQEMEAPVCLQFLCRLTFAKSGFVRIIHIWEGFSLGFIIWFKFASSTPALLILAKVESQLSQITDNS